VCDPHDGIAIWCGVDQRIAAIKDAHRKKLVLTRRLFEAGAPIKRCFAIIEMCSGGSCGRTE
jgi:hypothetical protein